MAQFKRHVFLAALVILAAAVLSRAQLLPEKSPRALPKPKPAPPARPVIQEPEMVRVPEGEFRMGSESGAEDEKPVHRVYVSEYYISKFAVSNLDYKVFVNATGHRAPAGKDKDRPLWTGSTFPPEIARQPVVKVSWDDAAAYCQWLSDGAGKQYQLPTEAQWEKAARGGLDQKRFPWGDQDPDETKAWWGKQWSGLLSLKDVDYGFANGYGLVGMAGNVKQWTADLYNRYYYAHSSPRDPQGPFGGLDRVVRGGSAFDDAGHLRSAARDFKLPTDRYAEVGFRVVRK